MKNEDEIPTSNHLIKKILFWTAGIVTAYFVFLVAMYFFFGARHVLLPIPTNDHSFAYELRIRKYLLKGDTNIIKYIGPVFYDDQPINRLDDSNIDTSEIDKVGICFLDGKKGSWIMTITYSGLFDEEHIVAQHTCNTDVDKDFFDY